jgi:hypothetical protein
MAKIYISYSRKDEDIARRISSGLMRFGHEISLELDSLSIGRTWEITTVAALQSSEVFIALLTQNSIESQHVIAEFGAARAFSQTTKKLLVLPVVWGEVDLPTVMHGVLYLSANDKNIGEVIERINGAIITFIGRLAAEEKKQVEVKERIESNAALYIDEAIKSLGEHEARNRKRGNLWYYLGYATLIAGVIFGAYSITQFANSNDVQWIRFAYLALKSIIIVGLLIACSKYSFTLGKSYMGEALKSADRIHAISFGKFYLRAFGEKADWVVLKEVFQHWNINNSSSFSDLDPNNFDPKFVEAVIEVAKTIATKK